MRRTNIYALVGATLAMSGALVSADDTDIYFSQAASANAEQMRPNILFILDTSGSMSGSVVGTRDNRIDTLKAVMKDVISNAQDVNIGLMRFNADDGGPVLFPAAYLDAPVTNYAGETSDTGGGGGAGAVDFSSTIANGNNDAEQVIPNGTPNLTDAVLDLGTRPASAGSGSLSQRIEADVDDAYEADDGSVEIYSTRLVLERDGYAGVRFSSVDIPQGAQITSAAVDFEVRRRQRSTTDVHIRAHKTADSQAFSEADNDLSSRWALSTSAEIDWQDVPAYSRGRRITTPDISDVIQEIVDQAGWNSGNALSLLFETTRGQRDFKSFCDDYTNGVCDDIEADRPRLIVEYTAPPTPAQAQRVALRFEGVNIPQGATVTAASLALTPSANRDDAASLTFTGEAADNAAPLDSGISLDGRTQTVTAVIWNNVPEWTQDDEVSTADAIDLMPILQEIVDRGGFCGGNAVTLFIEGTGTRQVYAQDDASGTPPRLEYGYDEASAAGCYVATESAQVVANDNDAEERANGDVTLGGSFLDLDANNEWVGVRFTDVNVPRGATITDARLLLTAVADSSGSASATVYAEAVDDATQFTRSDDNISNRPRTGAAVTWNFENPWRQGGLYTSPNLASVISEVINRGGWSRDQAINLILRHQSGDRAAVSHNNQPADAPILQITYQASGAGQFKTVRQRLTEIVDGLTARGFTPIVEVLEEAARYWRGESVGYGLARSQNTDRTSHPASYCDGENSCNGADTGNYPPFGVYRPSSCPNRDAENSSCRYEQIVGSPTYISPLNAETECAANYQVLLTDGAANATESDVKNRIRALTGTGCFGQNGDGGNYTSNEECGVDLAEFMHDVDQSDSMAGEQGVRTFTIAFNLSAPGASQFLMDLAAVGNGEARIPYDEDNPGSWSDGFYSATSAGALYEAFNNIVERVRRAPTSITSPSLATNAFNRLLSRDQIYFGLFTPGLETRWDGNLKRYRVCTDSSTGCTLGEIYDASGVLAIDAGTGKFAQTSRSFWSANVDGPATTEGGAGAELTNFENRVIFTDVTSSGVEPAAGTELDQSAYRITASTWSSDSLAEVRNVVCDPTPSTQAGSGCEDLMLYMLGKAVQPDNETDVSATTRWAFNDVLHSSPAIVTYGGADTDADGKVDVFYDKVLVGTNGGGLRMINATDGREDWIFVPQATLPNIRPLFENPETDHAYGLDLTPVLYTKDVDRDGTIEPADGDHVYAYIGMRRGGTNLYALDITPEAAVTSTSASVTPRFLWRIDGGADSDFRRLAYTWSKPRLATMRVGGTPTPVLIFGGGYDTALDGGYGTAATGGRANAGNSLYVVNAATGQRILAIGSCAGLDPAECSAGTDLDLLVPEMVHSIPSEPSVFDADGDGFVDRAYLADTGGNLWRVDFGALLAVGDPGDTVIGRLASLADPASESDQRRFFESPAVASVSDTSYAATPRYDYIAIGSGTRPDPLGNTVQDRFYAIRDYQAGHRMQDSDGNGLADAYPQPNSNLPINHATLIDATSSVLDGESDATRNSDGWFINLAAGEKVLSSPTIIAGTALFTTYNPDEAATANVCAVNIGAGRAYGIDLLDASERIDFLNNGPSEADGDMIDERGFIVGGGIPSNVVPIFTKEGVVTIVGTEGGAQTLDQVVTLPQFRTYWHEE